jgi:glutaredoxin
MSLKNFLLFSIAFIVAAASAQAEILKYTDSKGKTYFVDSEDKVPEPYKKQMGETKLPPISKMQSRTYEKIENPLATTTGRKKIEIFVTSWCPHCRDLEAYLTSKNVQFVRYDIEKDAAGKAKYDQMGVRGVPVVKYGSTVIRGFDRNQIEELITQ